MENLERNYRDIMEILPAHVQLVAVSKTYPPEDILKVYALGQRIFGENKVQELTEKYAALPKDIQWHLIGHLQTNKVRQIAPFVSIIESVDSEKLLLEIDRQAKNNDRSIKVLLQVKIAEEETKSGLTFEETRQIFNENIQGKFPNVEICGLMGMATFTEDVSQLKNEFTSLKKLFDELSSVSPLGILSMGMSGDFETAIACGSTSVRIGSAIFGSRH